MVPSEVVSVQAPASPPSVISIASVDTAVPLVIVASTLVKNLLLPIAPPAAFLVSQTRMITSPVCSVDASVTLTYVAPSTARAVMVIPEKRENTIASARIMLHSRFNMY